MSGRFQWCIVVGVTLAAVVVIFALSAKRTSAETTQPAEQPSFTFEPSADGTVTVPGVVTAKVPKGWMIVKIKPTSPSDFMLVRLEDGHPVAQLVCKTAPATNLPMPLPQLADEMVKEVKARGFEVVSVEKREDGKLIKLVTKDPEVGITILAVGYLPGDESSIFALIGNSYPQYDVENASAFGVVLDSIKAVK